MIIVRYADDIVVGFEHEIDARRFWEAMRERLPSSRCLTPAEATYRREEAVQTTGPPLMIGI